MTEIEGPHETLYVNNLSEKLKREGMCCVCQARNISLFVELMSFV